MKIFYNNKQIDVDENCTIREAVTLMEDIEHKAVWLNGEHVALSDFNLKLEPEDRLKIVRIRGGG
ncbi:MAG: hypothetical protein JEZ08_18955 [Clostridiales bacterium]|nr:hypothetical protein [Clostridiales bacterium]